MGMSQLEFAYLYQHTRYVYEQTIFLSLLMMIDIPPGYSDRDSLPSVLPSYSCQLANGEQRLDYTPRSRSSPTAVYIKNSGELSVLLNGQEENVTIPVFGRRSVISGTVLLSQRRLDSIRKIVLKVVLV